MIDLSRSIGIILDNAIEASTEIDDPIIRVAFIESENSVTFIVMNKCADDIHAFMVCSKKVFLLKVKVVV